MPTKVHVSKLLTKINDGKRISTFRLSPTLVRRSTDHIPQSSKPKNSVYPLEFSGTNNQNTATFYFSLDNYTYNPIITPPENTHQKMTAASNTKLHNTIRQCYQQVVNVTLGNMTIVSISVKIRLGTTINPI